MKEPELSITGSLAWLVWIVLCALTLIQMPFRLIVAEQLITQSDTPGAVQVDQIARALYLVAVVAFATMGLWVLRRRERAQSHMGWLMLLIGLVVALETFCSVYAIWGLSIQTGRQPPFVLEAAWVQHWIWTTRIALLFIFLPLLFPDGNLPSPWWKPLFWATVALHVSGLVPYALASIPLENNLIGLVEIPNPLAVPASATWALWLRPLPILVALPALIALWTSNTGWWRKIGVALYAAAIVVLAYLPGLMQIALLCLAAASSQFWRYRSASLVERQQIRSLALVVGVAGTLWAGSNIAWWLWREDGELIRDVLMVAYRLVLVAAPVALGLAILRHRLWDIDLILNRTLVYGALSTLVVAVYALIVSGLGLLFRNDSNLAASLLATGVIAVIFQPARTRVQDTTNRWLFGDRDDPAGVLTRLTTHLEAADSSGALLATLVETIATSLKLPYVALWLRTEDGSLDVAAQTGQKPDEVEMIPLMLQGEHIGQLVVAPRSPGEPLSTADQQLLAAIARLTATTARTIQLTDAVQEARVRTVSAREEERRRLRRDCTTGWGLFWPARG